MVFEKDRFTLSNLVKVFTLSKMAHTLHYQI